MNRTKDELLKSCIEQFEHIDDINNNEPLNTTKTLVMEIKQAINYSRCCKSDSEQLRDKKVKDLVNLAKSELSNYNKQKVLKAETEEDRQRTKLLKKIVDLQNP